MDYKPRQSYKGNSYTYKKKRIFWFNSAFNDDFTLINGKIDDITFNVPPFQTYKNNNLKLLTFVREDANSKPIIIKLKEPYLASRSVINTDKEAYPIIYANHTGCEGMTSKGNNFDLTPQQIPKFVFKFDENFNNRGGITANETLVQATNSSISVVENSKYLINYQNPTNIPTGTYETIFSNGAITFKSKPDYTYPTTSKSPIIWYKFDGSQFLYDSSSNYNLTNNNNVEIDEINRVKGSSSASFTDLANQYLSGSGFSISNASFSLSFWAYPKSSTNGCLIFFGAPALNQSVFICYGLGALYINKWAFGNYETGEDLSSTTLNDVNNWVHIVYTVDKNTRNRILYRNGVKILEGTTAINLSTTSTNYYLGYANSTYNKINGKIDDFRVFDYVLSPYEVYDLYNGNTDRSYPILKDANGDTINPTAWYKFDGSTAGLVVDASGNGYTLTNNNNIVYNSSIFVKGDGSAYLSQITDQSFSYSGLNLNNTSFTISFWAYLTAVNPENWVFTTDVIGSANRTLVIGIFSDRIRFAFYYNDLDYLQTTSNDINKWVHYTFVYDTSIPTGNNRFIYKNGVQVAGDRSSALSSPNTSGLIAKWNGAISGNRFTGYLDDFRVYNGRGLSATQVSELYNGRVSIYNPPNFEIGLEMNDVDLVLDNTISPYL